MPGNPENPAATVEAFRRHTQRAAARYRLERLASASWPIAWALALTLLVILVLGLVTPVAVRALPIVLASLVLNLVCALVVYGIGFDRHRLFKRMDTQAKLPDSVLSAGDWESTTVNDPWRGQQRIETLRLLEKVDWRETWPVRWPRLLWVPLANSVILAMALWIVQQHAMERTLQDRLALQQQNAPIAAEQLKPLEQVFQDWDDAQKIAPSPELAELLKEIKPMRDQMAAGKMTAKDVFLKLNDVQARLQAAQDKLSASSLEPLGQSLADAVKDLDGMSGLAAALQRQDFATARDQAAEAAEKYSTGAAKMPEGASAETAGSKLGEAAQQASSTNPQTSASLHQMQNSLSNKDSSGMCRGLGGLKECLGQQAHKQSQSHSLSLQLSQLSQCKNSMCNGSGIKMGLPQLSLAKSLQEQHGAGTGMDPNRTGPATQLDADHQQMKITGTAGDGASETQTESTTDPHSEQTAASVNASQYAGYKKLSDQATQDENLPVADRQMIKRYFEDIRPPSGP